jgi:hypothetical protein
MGWASSLIFAVPVGSLVGWGLGRLSLNRAWRTLAIEVEIAEEEMARADELRALSREMREKARWN